MAVFTAEHARRPCRDTSRCAARVLRHARRAYRASRARHPRRSTSARESDLQVASTKRIAHRSSGACTIASLVSGGESGSLPGPWRRTRARQTSLSDCDRRSGDQPEGAGACLGFDGSDFMLGIPAPGQGRAPSRAIVAGTTGGGFVIVAGRVRSASAGATRGRDLRAASGARSRPRRRGASRGAFAYRR